jgi:hypothetical protein
MIVTTVLRLLFWNVILCRSIMRGTCVLTYEMRSLLFWNVILCRSRVRGTSVLTYETRSLLFWNVILCRSIVRGTSVLTYEMRSLLFWYFMLRNNPEERRPYQQCSRSLKSHNLHNVTSQKLYSYIVFTLLVTYLKSTANVFPSFEKYLSNIESAV